MAALQETRFHPAPTHQENFTLAAGLFDRFSPRITVLTERAQSLKTTVDSFNKEMSGYSGERIESVVSEWRRRLEGFTSSYQEHVQGIVMARELTEIVKLAITDLESFPRELPSRTRLEYYGNILSIYEQNTEIQKQQLDILHAIQEELEPLTENARKQLRAAGQALTVAKELLKKSGRESGWSFPQIASPKIYEDAKKSYTSGEKKTELMQMLADHKPEIQPTRDGATISAYQRQRATHRRSRGESIDGGAASGGGSPAESPTLPSMTGPLPRAMLKTSYETDADEIIRLFKTTDKKINGACRSIGAQVQNIQERHIEIERRGGDAKIPREEIEAYISKYREELRLRYSEIAGELGGVTLLVQLLEKLDALHRKHQLPKITPEELAAFARMNPKFSDEVVARDTIVQNSWDAIADREMHFSPSILRDKCYAKHSILSRNRDVIEGEIARLEAILAERSEEETA